MCVQWQGDYREKEPVIRTSGVTVSVRTLLWVEALHRRVLPGFHVITTCDLPGCIATKHLAVWPVPRIGQTVLQDNGIPDLCQRGHDLTDPKVALWSGGKRRCRVCAKERRLAALASQGTTHPDHRRGSDGRYPVCRRGHPLTDGNVYVEGRGIRRCRECARNRQKLRASRIDASQSAIR